METAGDQGGRAAGSIEPDNSEQDKHRCRTDRYRLKKSYEESRKIHCRIMLASAARIDITHRLDRECHKYVAMPALKSW